MIHELREYTFEPDNWAQYLRLFRDVCLPVRRNDHGRLLGAWTAVSPSDQVHFVHLWAYDSLDTRAALRARLLRQPGWLSDFIEPVKPLVTQQVISILNPVGSVALDTGSQELDLLRISCAVGQATAIAKQVQAQGALCWTTEFADPNGVVCIGKTALQSRQLEAAVVSTGHVRRFETTKLVPLRDLPAF